MILITAHFEEQIRIKREDGINHSTIFALFVSPRFEYSFLDLLWIIFDNTCRKSLENKSVEDIGQTAT